MPIIYRCSARPLGHVEHRGFVIKKLLLIFILPVISLYAVYATDRNRQAEPVVYETDISFRGFPWGTSMDEFIKNTGNPISREEINGLVSLAWENINVGGYTTYMLAFFSNNGLQAGTHYFLTYNMDEHIRCYREVQQELRGRYGPTVLFNGIIRELRLYESSWHLPGGYVYLKVNTRMGDPVTLWYSSPELSRQLFGDREAVTAKR